MLTKLPLHANGRNAPVGEAAALVEKAQVQHEVAELQATHDAWFKAGMLGRLARCRAKLRTCMRVDEGAGPFGERPDYRVIRGY